MLLLSYYILSMAHVDGEVPLRDAKERVLASSPHLGTHVWPAGSKPAIMVIMEPWSTPKMHQNATFRIKPSIKPSILEWLITLIHLNPFDDNRWFDNPIKEAYQPNLYISFTIQGVGITPT